MTQKTLFDLEADFEEVRLYFKLRVPTTWVAADLPLQVARSNLESCVLLSDAPG